MYFEVSENFDKKLYMYISIIYVFVKFREKSIFCVVYVKKRKIILLKALFLAPNFIFFTHTTRQVEFS
jgi:hypothetical protein